MVLDYAWIRPNSRDKHLYFKELICSKNGNLNKSVFSVKSSRLKNKSDFIHFWCSLIFELSISSFLIQLNTIIRLRGEPFYKTTEGFNKINGRLEVRFFGSDLTALESVCNFVLFDIFDFLHVN